MLWTLVAILMVIILIPVAVRSLPAVGGIARQAVGLGGNILVAVIVGLVVLVVARRFLPALARSLSVELGMVVALLVLAVGGLFLGKRILAARDRADRGGRPPRR